MGFEAVSPAPQKYKEWLGTDKGIFMKPYIKKIPKPLKYCEELFDKDVLEIKQTTCKRYWRFKYFNP